MSIQTAHIKTVHYVHLSDVNRPIVPVLDQAKIAAMRSGIANQPQPCLRAGVNADKQIYTTAEIEHHSDTLPAIDVMTVSADGKRVFFGFGGCHRFQSYIAEGWDLIPVKLMPCSKSSLGLYLGSSATKFF